MTFPMSMGDTPRGHYHTTSGMLINAAAPDYSHVPLEDYAIGLSNYPRFAGQFDWKRWGIFHRWYSLAEHCVMVHRYVSPRSKDGQVLKLVALLHDAPEGTGLADMITPVKRLLPDYQAIEKTYEQALARRFDFDPALFSHPDLVEADLRVLATEWLQVRGRPLSDLSRGDKPWRPYPHLKLAGWSRHRARREYLKALTTTLHSLGWQVLKPQVLP